MRDPFNTYVAGEKALLYTQPQAVIGLGLAVHRPETVWSGTIATAPTFPADGTGVGQLAISTVSGTFANIVEGMTIVINNVYYTYARKAPSGTTLYIDGLGNGTVQTTVGTTVVAYKEHLPWPRRSRYSGGAQYLNFDLAYTDENTNFGPQAVMGCSAVIYKDGSQTFNFKGDRSKAWTPGSTISAYLWTFPDGTTSTSANPTWATSTAYPNGAYVSLRVTESVTGKTHTGYRLLFKFDSSNKPKTDFEITEFSGTWGDGYTLKITSTDNILNTQDTSTNFYTAKNHVVLFGTTAYGATVQDIGGNFPNRQNIWFDGWVTGVEEEDTYDGKQYVYTIQTIDGLLKELYGFPVALDNSAGASQWLEMTPCALDNVAIHWARYRSTVMNIVDLHLPETIATGSTKFGMDVSGASLWAQLQQIYSWIIGGSVSCDWQSAIYCEQDAFVAGTVASLPKAIGIFGEAQGSGNETDWLVRERHSYTTRPLYVRKIAKMTFLGVNNTTPVGSRSPDDPASHGGLVEEVSAGLLGTQTEMNLWTGNRQYQLNNPNVDQTFPMVGIVRIDCVPQCTVGTMYPGDSFVNPDYVWIVRGIDMEFDAENGMAYSTLHCERKAAITPQTGKTYSFATI